ncbi:MAG: alpha/beta hydrolase domain-containing protein [Janthinobacterium lividum]
MADPGLTAAAEHVSNAAQRPTRAATNFPSVPGLPFQDNFNNPLFVYDFGASFNPNTETGVIAQQPPGDLNILPLDVVKTNVDGNEVAGVASVLHQAPLGSYLGWNFYASGARAGTICAFSGGFYQFKVTAAERQVVQDPRPSLEERYGTHAGYAGAVQAAAKRSVSQGFLRQSDASDLVSATQFSNMLAGVAATPRGMSLTTLLCAAAMR